MPRIVTIAKIEKGNILKPSFQFEGKTKYHTSGMLKYFKFIPEGTRVKITIEWET